MDLSQKNMENQYLPPESIKDLAFVTRNVKKSLNIDHTRTLTFPTGRHNESTVIQCMHQVVEAYLFVKYIEQFLDIN